MQKNKSSKIWKAHEVSFVEVELTPAALAAARNAAGELKTA